LNSGWLIIFNRKPIKDRRSATSFEEAVGKREWIEEQGKTIEVIWL
jgi:hypothetical protein